MLGRWTVRNAGLAIVQVVFSALAIFVLYRTVLRYLSVTDLGVWSLLFALIGAGRLADLGFSASMTKFVATHMSQGRDGEAARIVETGVLTVAIAVAIVLLVGWRPVSSLLASTFSSELHGRAEKLIPFAALCLWLNVVNAITNSAIDGCLRTDIRSGLQIVASLITVIVGTLVIPSYGLVGLAVSLISSSLFSLIASWIALRRLLPRLSRFPCVWDKKAFLEQVRYNVAIQIGSWATLLFDPTTKWLLGVYGSMETVGYFELASQVVSRARALLVSAFQVLVPVFASLSESNESRLKGIYEKVLDASTGASLCCMGAVAAYLPLISILWLGRVDGLFIGIGMVLAVAWLVNAVCAPAYFAFQGRGQVWWNTLGLVTMGLVNGFAGLFLGIGFGAWGVVTAYAIALAFGSAVSLVAFHLTNGIAISRLASRASMWMTGFVLAANCVCYGYLLVLGGVITLLHAIAAGVLASLTILVAGVFHPSVKVIWQIARRPIA